MESLANYDSDDDATNNLNTRDDTHKNTAMGETSGQRRKQQLLNAITSDGTNYEQIQMDVSEESNPSTEESDVASTGQLNANKIAQSNIPSNQHSSITQKASKNESREKRTVKNADRNSFKDEDKQKSRDKERERNRDREYDRRDKADKEKDKYRKSRDEHDRDRDYRRERDNKEREYNRNKDYHREREKRDRVYNVRDRDHNRERDFNRNDRIQNREPRDCRNKDNVERHTAERSSHDIKDRKRSRSRSKSRDHPAHTTSSTSSTSSSSSLSVMPLSRTERSNMKVQQLKKMGIEITGKSNVEPNHDEKNTATPFTINPRYAEQIQKRKLLWANKPNNIEKPKTTTNKWEDTKFSHDTDGKMASKFLRLMGMKEAPKSSPCDDTNTVDSNKFDLSKKQAEMFSTMEQQYEVARQVTHTMRGMGLGFGTHQRQY